MESDDMIDVSAKTTAPVLSSSNGNVSATARAALEKAAGNKSAANAKKAYGPQLSLKLRRLNGTAKAKKIEEYSVKHRQREPLEALMEQFRTKLAKATPQQKFVFSFDGQVLDLSKTPATYDMEPMDLIDVVEAAASAGGSRGARARNTTAAACIVT